VAWRSEVALRARWPGVCTGEPPAPGGLRSWRPWAAEASAGGVAVRGEAEAWVGRGRIERERADGAATLRSPMVAREGHAFRSASRGLDGGASKSSRSSSPGGRSFDPRSWRMQ